VFPPPANILPEHELKWAVILLLGRPVLGFRAAPRAVSPRRRNVGPSGRSGTGRGRARGAARTLRAAPARWAGWAGPARAPARRSVSVSGRTARGRPRRGWLQISHGFFGQGHSGVWDRLLADAGGDFSAQDPVTPPPRPAGRHSAWVRWSRGSRRGGAWPRGGAFPPNSGASPAARRYRESSRAARSSGQLPFPAGVGGAVRRRGGRVSQGYSQRRRRRVLVRRPAPWRAARRGLRRALRRASASPPSCWAPRCSRCRCSRAPACRAAPRWRSTWPGSTRCCCCSTGRRATRYMCSLSLFHYSEYLVTAVNNPKSLSLDSFLLNHSLEYTVAALSSWIEFTLENIFWPELKQITWLSATGLLMVVFGECLRKAAMFTAGSNFNHVVQNEKSETHTLVTSGVYAWFRHPSYVGWFYWSIGTQVMLCNPICGVGYALTVWRFFRDRTEEEEISLIHFFGEEYLEYKKRVPTGLPFIKGVKVEL
uniref:Protein-S-isoprenylcysteine O-methyltransferase n=2 Tax=Equus asinus TaxID=9793 RepID=A0A9L0K2K0_EQUAS